MTTRPARNVTPSCWRRMRCVTIPLARARGLIPPRAFTTRCHGISGGHTRMAWPTRRAAAGRPSRAAISPYDSTWPRGIVRTRRYTAVAKCRAVSRMRGLGTELQRAEARVQTALAQQRLVRSLLVNDAVAEHEDAVGALDR